MDYSLSDVVRITGGKRRSVQLWAEAGAILAYPSTERRGTGTHRLFSRDEAVIACCLNGLAKRQVGIGELIRIGSGLRSFLNTGKPRTKIENIVTGISGPGEWLLVMIWPEDTDVNPEVFLLDESELSHTIATLVKGDGFAIVIPLAAQLRGLRDDQQPRPVKKQKHHFRKLGDQWPLQHADRNRL